MVLINYLKRLLFKAAGKIIRLKSRVLKPFSIGVRALVITDKKEVLLVKHTYTDLWYLPGGGVNKREPLLKALNRELKEEAGLTILEPPTLLGTYSNFFEGKSDYVSVFIVEKFEMEFKKNFEIQDWRFYSIDNLPGSTSAGTKKRIKEYQKQKVIDFIW